MSETQSNPPAASAGVLDNALTELLRYLKAREERERKDIRWATVKRSFFALVALSALLFYLVFYAQLLGIDSSPSARSVALIPIHGQISSESDASAEAIVPLIDRACESEAVEHIVLDINSPGGAPNESERIVAAIEGCRKEKGKKFTALIDGLGASAAYMIAIHADQVIAGRYSIVGSVGAIMRYVDASAAATKLGLREHVYRSGILKGGPSPMSGSDDAMDKVNQEMVVRLGQDFLSEVYEQRRGKLKAPRDDVFTGRIWTAPDALQMGLIDCIATLEELQRTDFKDLRVHQFKPKTPFAKGLGFQALFDRSVRDSFNDLETPEIR